MKTIRVSTILRLGISIYVSINCHLAIADGLKVTNLGTLEYGYGSQAISINNQGQVTGLSYYDDSNGYYGFFWENGVMTENRGLGGFQCSGNAINDLGTVVGSSYIPNNLYHHAYISPSIDLGTLGGKSSNARDINNLGEIVGYSYSSWTDGTMRGFLWRNDGMGMRSIGTLGYESYAYGINNKSQIVGHSYINQSGSARAFLWDNGIMTSLGTLGGSSSFGHGINDDSQIVGWSYISSGTSYHAFLWENGVMIDLGTLGGQYSLAYRINNNALVAGVSLTESGEEHAVIWENGIIHDLNDLIDMDSGWVLQEAFDLNDYGQIVGYGLYDDGTGAKTRAFLLDYSSSVPEPNTMILLLMSIICLLKKML